MNGYFRIIPHNDATEIALYAPTEGGAPLTLNKVTEYLVSKAISHDVGELSRAVEQAGKKDTKIRLNSIKMAPLNASLAVSISKDKMEASISLYAPSEGGKDYTYDELVSELSFKGIRFGVLTETLKQLATSPRYCEEIVVAYGEKPEAGTDGYVEYLFNTDKNIRPAMKEDGSVDFFNLNVLNTCAKNQVIAKLHGPVRGANGHFIDGTEMPSREPKEVAFRYGNNVLVSEDGTQLISACDGSVELLGEQVFVNNSISFKNIGTATGNIEYEGNVTVEGNVDTNFSVKGKGDIVINGVVEGAVIEAGGNIIIAKGVNGMGKAVLKAGGNIIVKYMENVSAVAGGYIHAEAIMHSTISAGGDIFVDGRRGVLSGGKASAGGNIEVRNLGAEMANDTIVEVGLSPEIKREINELRKQAAEKQKTLASIMPVLQTLAVKIKSGTPLSNEQKSYVAKLMTTQKVTTEELTQINERLEKLEGTANVDTESEVRVKGTVYPGTRVCISDVSMAVKTPTKYCKFVKLRGDVKITSFD